MTISPKSPYIRVLPVGLQGHLGGPEYRGRGLGRKLIAGIEEMVQNRAIGISQPRTR